MEGGHVLNIEHLLLSNPYSEKGASIISQTKTRKLKKVKSHEHTKTTQSTTNLMNNLVKINEIPINPGGVHSSAQQDNPNQSKPSSKLKFP